MQVVTVEPEWRAKNWRVGDQGAAIEVVGAFRYVQRSQTFYFLFVLDFVDQPFSFTLKSGLEIRPRRRQPDQRNLGASVVTTQKISLI